MGELRSCCRPRVRPAGSAVLGLGLGLGLLLALGGACRPKPVPNDPDAHVPLATAPTWKNWSRNLVHRPALDGGAYYFTPTSRAELRTIVKNAAAAGVSLRVTGQRHSQPPLVASDNRDDPPATTRDWIVDLSCYHDLGPDGTLPVELDAEHHTVTVNAGVREDQVDAFLTEQDFMLQTVTAGGFFSIGGMTAVDVNGATIAAPIFAETASAFTIMGPDGEVTTIDASTPKVNGWSPLQFARVSLGSLGIVTAVTLDVVERPWATSLVGGRQDFQITDQATFVNAYRDLLTQHDRLESFYNPYSGGLLALWWDRDPAPADPVPNHGSAFATACTFAEDDLPGAPYEVPTEEQVAEKSEETVQLNGSREDATLLIDFALADIREQVRRADERHSDLWLEEAARVVFMSYFIELPAADDEGLGRVWAGIDAITQRLAPGDFLIAGPLEFRFIRAGDSALSATYSTNPDALFVNLDLLAFVPVESADRYPEAMLRFFADVEREWVALGGMPHNGKMYGFYDPGTDPGQATPPFHPAYLSDLALRRGERMEAFEAYRFTRDPGGLFCNEFLTALTLCSSGR